MKRTILAVLIHLPDDKAEREFLDFYRNFPFEIQVLTPCDSNQNEEVK